MGKGRTEGRSPSLGYGADDSSEHTLPRNVGGVGTATSEGTGRATEKASTVLEA